MGPAPVSGQGPLCLPRELSPPSEAPPAVSPLPRRKAVKATLVLLPLLGTTYILFLVNLGQADDLSDIVFIYFNSFLQSFQVGPGPRGPANFLTWVPKCPHGTVTHGTGAHVGHSGTHSNISVHTLNPTPEPRWAPPGLDGVWVSQLAPTASPEPALSHLHHERWPSSEPLGSWVRVFPAPWPSPGQAMPMQTPDHPPSFPGLLRVCLLLLLKWRGMKPGRGPHTHSRRFPQSRPVPRAYGSLALLSSTVEKGGRAWKTAQPWGGQEGCLRDPCSVEVKHAARNS